MLDSCLYQIKLADLPIAQEERETLLSSFRSVKTEFCDLDGLSWSEYSFNDGLVRHTCFTNYFVTLNLTFPMTGWPRIRLRT